MPSHTCLLVTAYQARRTPPRDPAVRRGDKGAIAHARVELPWGSARVCAAICPPGARVSFMGTTCTSGAGRGPGGPRPPQEEEAVACQEHGSTEHSGACVASSLSPRVRLSFASAGGNG
mmetsp:Transcript_55613/g.127763  ORF Transcript_55613/g.127763 Transcript_55613/m.127763 type:complete len:119 (+) Transcript_55613:251-607(+)